MLGRYERSGLFICFEETDKPDTIWYSWGKVGFETERNRMIHISVMRENYSSMMKMKNGWVKVDEVPVSEISKDSEYGQDLLDWMGGVTR